MRPNFRVDFISKKMKRDFLCKIKDEYNFLVSFFGFLFGFILNWISLKTSLKVIILTGKRILRRQKIKEITKEKENKRHQNQKNEVFKRKVKNKDNKRKRKYGRSASWC